MGGNAFRFLAQGDVKELDAAIGHEDIAGAAFAAAGQRSLPRSFTLFCQVSCSVSRFVW
jgi:hypothetical protein